MASFFNYLSLFLLFVSFNLFGAQMYGPGMGMYGPGMGMYGRPYGMYGGGMYGRPYGMYGGGMYGRPYGMYGPMMSPAGRAVAGLGLLASSVGKK